MTRPSGTTPCFGQSDLFDRTDLAGHARAREICSTCPAIDACRENLRKTQAMVMPKYGPEGTWAGVLFRQKDAAA